MAKILTEMPKRVGGAGRKAIYPYDEWLDGQIRQLEPNVDYHAKPQSVVASIRQTAEARGLRLRSRFLFNDDKEVTGIVIQTFTEVADEPEQVLPKSNKRPRSKQAA
jgi:hypothetical protein